MFLGLKFSPINVDPLHVRIVSLEPYATEILVHLGVASSVVGITHLGETLPKGLLAAIVTQPQQQPQQQYTDAKVQRLVQGLTPYALDMERLKELLPHVVLADIREGDKAAFIAWAEEYLTQEFGQHVTVRDVSATNLAGVYHVIDYLGGLVDKKIIAHQVVSNTEAQLMQWADSFFERCRGKQVAVLSCLDPLKVEGRWFPELIRMFGARSIERAPSMRRVPITWPEVRDARVDVLVIAPEHSSLAESVKTLPVLQSLAGWDEIPAVKRGEVIFAAGTDLYRPGPRFIKGAAVLVSAIAGLDSGYITGRDDYVKIRYVELHRHRFL